MLTAVLPPMSASSTLPQFAPRSSRYVPAFTSRSCPPNFAYARNNVGDPITPALASESAASRKLAPGGMTTRTGGPSSPGGPHDESDPAPMSTAASRAARASRHAVRRSAAPGEGIDVALPPAGGAPHLADRAKRRRGGEPLVDELRGQPGAVLQLAGDPPD